MCPLVIVGSPIGSLPRGRPPSSFTGRALSSPTVPCGCRRRCHSQEAAVSTGILEQTGRRWAWHRFLGITAVGERRLLITERDVGPVDAITPRSCIRACHLSLLTGPCSTPPFPCLPQLTAREQPSIGSLHTAGSPRLSEDRTSARAGARSRARKGWA